MLNKKFTGVITAVSTIGKSAKAEDGTKIKTIYNQIKLESADIDYESMNEFNMNIAQSLLAIQPMPFDMVSFGKQMVRHLCLNLKAKMTIDEPEPNDGYTGINLVEVEMEKINVIVKQNIPTYVFVLHVPIEKNPQSKYVPELFKQISEFEFSIAKETV